MCYFNIEFTLIRLRYLDSSLGDADGLLLHGFMDGHLVLEVHLVKLINAAHALEDNTVIITTEHT